ncbi:hypothetical protein F0562_008310 [Nyssa sinensis]|uniref:Retrotransposon gag domain-containing protein n=1 Tax=Nyssa sinensis TaxID=561372 RepID=A0A5J5A8Z5_9ASTE|nr:hypothetical protein F0562_008310 [Nyssa sinensis]
MDTRGKTNAEFRNDVNEILTRHESSFDQVNVALQMVLTELQAIRISRSTNTPHPDINPFAQEESSHPHTSRSNTTSNPSHHHLKLSFPKFNGDDPTGWVYKAEQYFDFKNIAPDQQVQLASFHLEGIALQWHRWWTKFRGPLTWDEFTKALSHRVDGLPESFLIGCFIAGLRDDIRLDVKVKQPRTLVDAIGVARLVEERNHLQTKLIPPFRSQSVPSTPRATPNPTAGVLGPPPNQRMHPSPNTPPTTFRRINTQEARERRKKGLCYYCDEKFAPGHRCKRPQLFMIEDSPQASIENVEGIQLETEHHEAIPEISFHAITGTQHPQTIRVLGKLKNKNVMVLIDGSSTHNFIDQAIVSKFGLPVIQDKKFQVMVANQEKIECVGQCRALTVTIQGHSVTADYYILLVAAYQLVLGVQWLETLGPIETDYKQLTMTFKVEGISHTF